VASADIQGKFSMVKHLQSTKICENRESFSPRMIWHIQWVAQTIAKSMTNHTSQLCGDFQPGDCLRLFTSNKPQKQAIEKTN